MTVGQPYNPYRLFYGVFIPEWLLRSRAVKAGPKLLFALLVKEAGDEGACAPDAGTLAAKLGIGERQFWEYVGQLRDAGFIAARRRGLGLTNVYTFLWPAEAEESALRQPVPDVNGSADQDAKRKPSEVQRNGGAPPDVQPSAYQEVRGSAHTPYSKVDIRTPNKKPNAADAETPMRARASDGGRLQSSPVDPHRSQAAELYRQAETPVFYSLTRAGLHGEAYQRFLDTIALHLRNGAVVTLETLQDAAAQARAEYEAKNPGRNRARVPAEWLYPALADVLARGAEPPPAAKPLPRPDATRLRSWRQLQCQFAYDAQWSDVEAEEDSHRDWLRGHGWPEALIEAEIALDREYVREKFGRLGCLDRLNGRAAAPGAA